MGYFSELAILLDTIPRDREDPIFAKKPELVEPQTIPENFTLWDLTEEELVSFISGKTTPKAWDDILIRLASEAKERAKPVQFTKK